MGYKPGIFKVLLWSIMAKVMVVVIAFGLVTATLCPEGTAQTWGRSKKEKKKEDPRITEAELQSQVMGFADRFAVIMVQAFEDFMRNAPSRKALLYAQDDMTYCVASAFTIAAAPNPQVAMLDMAALGHTGQNGLRGTLACEVGQTDRIDN